MTHTCPFYEEADKAFICIRFSNPNYRLPCPYDGNKGACDKENPEEQLPVP